MKFIVEENNTLIEAFYTHIDLKGQEYKIAQKYFRLCTFCGFYVHKIHKKCTI